MKYKTKASKLIKQYTDQHSDQSFTAHHLYEYIVEQGQAVNLSTIFRNLDQFVDEGILTKFKTGHNDVFMYRVNQDVFHCHEHLHLQCKECGKIIHIKKESMDSIIAMLEKDYKFFLDCDISTIGGLCKTCMMKKELK